MAERKSLSDAMSMNPEKLAFIKQGAAGNTLQEPPREPAMTQKTIDLQLPSPPQSTVTEPKPKSLRSQGKDRVSRAVANPNANEILDQVLVPVTIRLQHRTSQALRRAYLEQRLKHAKPDTQQEIVEIALQGWLQREGYL